MANDLEANKQVVRDFLAALGKGDVARMGELCHPELQAVAKGTCFMSGTRDAAEVLSTAGLLGSIVQDGIQFTIGSMTAEDDRVSAEVTGKSTLVNGKPYNNSYHFFAQIRDGQVIQLNEYFCTKLAEDALGPIVMAGQAQ